MTALPHTIPPTNRQRAQAVVKRWAEHGWCRADHATRMTMAETVEAMLGEAEGRGKCPEIPESSGDALGLDLSELAGGEK